MLVSESDGTLSRSRRDRWLGGAYLQPHGCSLCETKSYPASQPCAVIGPITEVISVRRLANYACGRPAPTSFARSPRCTKFETREAPMMANDFTSRPSKRDRRDPRDERRTNEPIAAGCSCLLLRVVLYSRVVLCN